MNALMGSGMMGSLGGKVLSSKVDGAFDKLEKATAWPKGEEKEKAEAKKGGWHIRYLGNDPCTHGMDTPVI